eukprot:61864_1
MKFAKIFKNVPNWKKKMFAKIYDTMNNWTPLIHDEMRNVEQKSTQIETPKIQLDEKEQKIKPNNDTNKIYEDGVEFWYWEKQKQHKRFIKKKFSNLKEEMLEFKGLIPLCKWMDLVNECKDLIQTNLIKTLSCNGTDTDIYEIANDEKIDEQHLIAMKLYTDFDTLNTIFCKAFRQIKDEGIQLVETRNEKVANWSKLLIETVQCFGEIQKLQTKRKKKYYRGIKGALLFQRFITKFNAPLSTTEKFEKALNFEENGVVMQLGLYNQNVSCFNAAIMSAFPNEKEMLFFTKAILKLTSIYQYNQRQWQSYQKYIIGIQNVTDMANSLSSMSDKRMKHIIGYLLPDLHIDKKELPTYVEELLNHHISHLSSIEYDFRKLCHDYQWAQNIFVTSPYIPKISNMCNLFQKHNHITITMSHDHTIDDNFCESIIKEAA